MDIKQIDAKYRVEMVGAFKKLRDMVEAGELSVTQFQVAQTRIFLTYLEASK